MDKKYLVGFILFIACSSEINGCRITGYVDMKMMERLVQSTYIVYGRTIWHEPTKVTLNGVSQYIVDASYEVHCIFKEGEDAMNEQITISQISPATDCPGTSATSHLKVGDFSILALKNTTDGKYALEEVMPATSAAFYPMKPYIFSLANTCTMQNWKSPVGATTNKCPICGIADFAAEVTALDNTGGSTVNCEYTTNGIDSDMTGCDLYIKGSIDYANLQTCVPATFNQTCVTLLYRTASATCDCTPQTNNNDIGTGDGNALMPSVFFAFSFLLCLVLL